MGATVVYPVEDDPGFEVIYLISKKALDGRTKVTLPFNGSCPTPVLSASGESPV